MDGRIYRHVPGGRVCRLCEAGAGLHRPHCEVLQLIRELEAIAAALGGYVADMRDTIATVEKIVRGEDS